MKVHIQTVPARERWVTHDMLPRLQANRSADITLWVDEEGHGPLWNAKRIFAEVARGGHPALVLQDDILLHDQFWECVSDITPHMATLPAVSLYARPKPSTHAAIAAGCNIVRCHYFLCMPGMILRPDFCTELVRYGKDRPLIKRAPRSCDVFVNAYQQHSKTPIYTIVPSIVQHNLNMESTIGHKLRIEGRLRRSTAWVKTIPAGYFKELRVMEQDDEAKVRVSPVRSLP